MLQYKSLFFSINFSFLSARSHFWKVLPSAVPGIHINIPMRYLISWCFSTSLMEIYTNFYNFFEIYSFKKYENFLNFKILFFQNTFFSKYFFHKCYNPNVMNLNEKYFWISFIYFNFSQKPDDIILNQALMENQNIVITHDVQKQLIESSEEYFLQQLDFQFRSKITSKSGYFSNIFNSFEFESPVLFSKNSKFENYFFDGFLKTASFIVIYELLSSFYFEPVFFFWEKIERTLTEFWLVCYFWEWSTLFEEWVYHPKIIYNDPNHIYPPFSHLSHKSDLDFGYKLIADLFEYKNISTFSYYLEFQDFQTYAFDKHYIYLWDYNIGASNPLNVFGPKGWTGYINFFREQLASPKIQFPSTYLRNDKGYDSFASWTLNFAFFPDQVLLWGIFNPNFDWLTAGYNWFFHFGDSYIDYCIGLDLIWHQITDNYWGDFEYIVEDFTVYQTTYFPDSLATLRLPVILLATKNYVKPSDMNLHINDFNGVFQFKRIKTFEDFNSEKFFSLDPLSRLELLRDFQQIDEKPFHLEKVLNMYYAYNSSCFLANLPSWLLNLAAPEDIYSTLIYDYEEDYMLEEWEWIILKWLAVKNYDYSTNLSIYFKTRKFDNFFFNLPRFLNEKIFDDIGFFYGLLNWTEKFESPTTFTWLNTWSLLTVEYIPIEHFTWNLTFFESTPFWFNIILKLPTEFFIKFSELFSNTFTIKIVNHTYVLFTENKNKIISYNLNLPSLYFEINLLPILEFIFSKINSKFYDQNSISYLYYKFYEGNVFAFLDLFTIYNFIDFNNFIYNITKMIHTFFTSQLKIYFYSNHNLKLELDFFKLKYILSSLYNFLYFEKICYLIESNLEIYIKNIQEFSIPKFFKNFEIFYLFPINYNPNSGLPIKNFIFLGNQLNFLFSNLQPTIVKFLYLIWYFFSSPDNFLEIRAFKIIENLFNCFNFENISINYNLTKNIESRIYIIELPFHLLLKLSIFEYFFNNFSLLQNLFISFFIFEYRSTAIQYILIPGTNQPILIIDKFKTTLELLPIEFFLPVFKYNSNWYLFERCLFLNFSKDLVLPDGSLVVFNNLWQLERYVGYCIVLDIQLKTFNEKELMEVISAINAIDFNATKTNRLEYDRYINYVLWKKLYKKKN